MSSLFASRKASGLLTVASALMFAATTAAETESAQLCKQFQAYPTPNGQYIFNNNAWGEDDSGAECTTVFDDGASFETIWSWKDNGNNTHSFPNVQLNSAQLLPMPLKNISAMNLAASWSMAPIDGNTRANVVYDMFVDTDADTSANATTAKYEMMIWIGAFDDPFPLGASINPFGVVNTSLPHVTINTTDFTLFSGENDGGQTVHSWLTTTTNVTDFSGDVTPLITYLTNHSLMETDAFLGLIQFGSETWHAENNVTFAVSSFDINVTSTDAEVNAAAASALVAATASPTSGSSGSSATGSSSSGSSSGSSTSSGSSSSSSSSGTSGASSIISMPFWFWEIAAAGCLFAML